MTTIRQVRAAAEKIGATVTDEKIGSTHTCSVEAPEGHHWTCGLHEFVNSAYRPWKPDYADLLSRMSDGIEPCKDDCEWHEDADDAAR